MLQIIKQTDEEKMAMYMKMKKEELASMLVQCNKILDGIGPRLVPTKEVPFNE